MTSSPLLEIAEFNSYMRDIASYSRALHRFVDIGGSVSIPANKTRFDTSPGPIPFTKTSSSPDLFPLPHPLISDLTSFGLNSTVAQCISDKFLEVSSRLKAAYEIQLDRTRDVWIAPSDSHLPPVSKFRSRIQSIYKVDWHRKLKFWTAKGISITQQRLLATSLRSRCRISLFPACVTRTSVANCDTAESLIRTRKSNLISLPQRPENCLSGIRSKYCDLPAKQGSATASFAACGLRRAVSRSSPEKRLENIDVEILIQGFGCMRVSDPLGLGLSEEKGGSSAAPLPASVTSPSPLSTIVYATPSPLDNRVGNTSTTCSAGSITPKARRRRIAPIPKKKEPMVQKSMDVFRLDSSPELPGLQTELHRSDAVSLSPKPLSPIISDNPSTSPPRTRRRKVVPFPAKRTYAGSVSLPIPRSPLPPSASSDIAGSLSPPSCCSPYPRSALSRTPSLSSLSSDDVDTSPSTPPTALCRSSVPACSIFTRPSSPKSLSDGVASTLLAHSMEAPLLRRDI
ncbi:hypothetical protein EW146_g9091 [Bondarzewia mesenterica]|uniref:A2 mating type protein n=1 Tax=Bondarzewia mesenterica TaxID=1095465 RepID=A0A4S4L9B6_9AGAM|nr:hypothetical protein EW146_g9091 [Bondarzewia mesenterica]